MWDRLPITMNKVKKLQDYYRYHPSHILWLLLFLLSLLLQACDWVQSWRFDRSLVEQGDVWLLFSGHIVHLNWSHWLLNMAGLGNSGFFL